MEELKCPLCKKEYSEINPPRLLTMCGHTYCQECLKTLIKRKEYRFQIRCPEDKLKMNIDSTTPLQFPRNMILVQKINKNSSKVHTSQDQNEFLPSQRDVISVHSRSSLESKRSSAFTTKRTSLEEGVCLLHQKHLDIICLHEKISICAECALFGLHKGHSFTTIRDLEKKRNDWINQVGHIMEEKKSIQQKQAKDQVQVEILRLLNNKKQKMLGQLDESIKKIREEIDNAQKKMKKQIQQSLQNLTAKLIEKCPKSYYQTQFKEWKAQISQWINQFQNQNVVNSIDIYADIILGNKENFIEKGADIINKLKKESQSFWNQIQESLKYPTLSICSNISKYIQQMISLNLKQPERMKISTLFDDRISIRGSILNQSQIFSKKNQFEQTRYQFSNLKQDVSLLDLDENSIFSEITMRNTNDFKMQSSTETPSFIKERSVSNTRKQNIKTIKSFKKKDNNQLPLNKSLINLHQGRNNMASPLSKKKKTQFLSRGLLPSSHSPMSKDQFKRNTLKVKDLQKFEKLIKALQNDSTQSLDFTGLQLGNDLCREVCLKLKSCKKVKTVRLMKNQLEDECINSLMEILPSIDILNLAQNLFTSKILDNLLSFCKEKKLEKIKNIQLGHNNINARKFKDRIEELKKYGVFISL